MTFYQVCPWIYDELKYFLLERKSGMAFCPMNTKKKELFEELRHCISNKSRFIPVNVMLS